jgi:hypothetical protein
MILKHLLDSLTLILWMTTVGIALAGWGALLCRWLEKDRSNADQKSMQLTQCIYNTWLGICICISLTELLHFFAPITWVASVAILGFGFIYTVTRKQFLIALGLWATRKKRSVSPTGALYLFACLAVAFIWISAAMVGPTNYDSGLYHFGAIKWLNEQSITYGLVNLHTRLAYNQSYFALIALVNFAPFYDYAYAGTGVLFFLLTAATCLQLLREQSDRAIFWLFGLLILVGPLVLKTSSPTPDLAVGLLQVVIFFILFVRAAPLISLAGQRPVRLACVCLRLDATLPLLVLLCVTAITIKLSMALFCLGALCVVYRQIWTLLIDNKRLAFKLCAVASVILGIHALRGYALSGVPFYPSSIAGLWSLPYTPDPVRITAEASAIYSWARLPEVPPAVVLSNWDWVKPWFAALPARFLVLCGLAATLFVANSLLLFFSTRREQLTPTYRLYLPLLFSCLFWFLTAPDVRFLGVVPELLVMLGGWFFWLSVREELSQHITQHAKYYRLTLASAVICMLLFGGFTAAYRLTRQTGLGLGQSFYLNDILFGLSQIGVNAKFVFLVIFGLMLVRYRQKFCSEPGSQGAARDGINQLVRLGHHGLTAAFLCSIILYAADSAKFSVSSLKGWVSIPTEPYEQQKILSGLLVNVPKSDDLCWATPLPCQPRQQFHPNLNFIDDDTLSGWFPKVRLFKFGP